MWFPAADCLQPLLSSRPGVFGVLVPPQCLWVLLSLAKAAFPDIPAQGEQELSQCHQAGWQRVASMSLPPFLQEYENLPQSRCFGCLEVKISPRSLSLV